MILDNFNFANPKIVTIESLIKKLTENRDGKTLITTNGCFDILHPGHIKFLENARSLGDILVVVLNSDSSVRAIKGNSRPVISEQMRAYALASLIFTDYIVIFQENTPEKVLAQIKPDIHAKGEDYKESGIPEKNLVESFGGKVLYLPLVQGYSTTTLLNKRNHFE